MAYAYVQSISPNLGDASITTATATLGSNLTAGNFAVAAFTWDTAGGTAVTSVAAGSDTFTQLGPTIGIGNGQALAVYYRENLTGGGNTIVLTFGTGHAFVRMAVAEYSGLATSSSLVGAPATHDAFAVSTATDNATVGTVTPTATGQLVLGVICIIDQSNETYSAGTGFTQRVQSFGVTGAALAIEDRAAATTSAQSATWTVTAGTTVGGEAYAAVFALPGGGSTIVSPVRVFGASYAAQRAASI